MNSCRIAAARRTTGACCLKLVFTSTYLGAFIKAIGYRYIRGVTTVHIYSASSSALTGINTLSTTEHKLSITHAYAHSRSHQLSSPSAEPAALSTLHIHTYISNMTIFACKATFMELGIEKHQPSAHHAFRDCDICGSPLAVPRENTRHAPGSRFHTPIRIVACGHAVGEECFNAWLDTGNTCPVKSCNRLLFEPTKETLTVRDANDLMLDLGGEFGERHVIGVLAHLIQTQEEDSKKLKQQHEIEVTKQRMRDEQRREEEMASYDDDWSRIYDEERDIGEESDEYDSEAEKDEDDPPE
jgi:hypothetical protein